MTAESRYRLWEIIPGFLIWSTLIGAVLLSFFQPIWMMYFVIIFDLYWLFRVFYFTPFIFLTWFRYRAALKRDWQTDAEALPDYSRVEHVVFLPFSKESASVVRETLKALMRVSYPAKRMVIVLAGEARFSSVIEEVEREILPEFNDAFRAVFLTKHPPGQPGEIPGKGSNLNYAGRTVLPELLALGLEPDLTIASSFDIDTIVHKQYFSALTYTYLTVKEPTRSSYQPMALYNNNLWESPAMVRVAMFGTSFWLMQELARPEGMMTFSSHSMSLRMLMDVGFWQKDVVSEDSRIFLQGLIKYHGRYRVTPIHLPVSMDTVMTDDYWKAMPALYKQLRRWAWGMENFPFMMETVARDKKFPLWKRITWIFKQVEGGVMWATAPVLIFILGFLPFWAAPTSFHSFVLFQNTPFTLQWLMRLSMLGLFLSAGLSLTLLPPPPQHRSKPFSYLIILLQWVLSPVTYIIFGSVPATDAMTRLMLGGKYRLGFFVSPKRSIQK